MKWITAFFLASEQNATLSSCITELGRANSFFIDSVCLESAEVRRPSLDNSRIYRRDLSRPSVCSFFFQILELFVVCHSLNSNLGEKENSRWLI